MKSLFSFLAISVCFLLTANCAAAQTDSATKAVIQVTNLTCNGDMPTIRKSLLNKDGVESVTFSQRVGGSSTFTIMYLDKVINAEQLQKAIETTPGCDDKNSTPYRVKKEKTAKAKQP